LAGLQEVVLGGVQREVGATVVEGDTSAGNHDTGTEAHVVGLDPGYHVAFLISGAQIYGTAGEGSAGLRHYSSVGDELSALSGILFRQHVSHLGLHGLGIGYIFLTIYKGQLHGFDGLVVYVYALT